jgi:hypothetical protein
LCFGDQGLVKLPKEGGWQNTVYVATNAVIIGELKL